MMKSRKLALMFLVVAMVTAMSTSSFATTHTFNSNGQSFGDSWEEVDSGSGWTIKYGYNEFLINEDYTHTVHGSDEHRAIVINGKGTHQTSYKEAGKWAKIEVQHASANPIQYKITY